MRVIEAIQAVADVCVLESYEAALAEKDAPGDGLFSRIEHAAHVWDIAIGREAGPDTITKAATFADACHAYEEYQSKDLVDAHADDGTAIADAVKAILQEGIGEMQRTDVGNQTVDTKDMADIDAQEASDEAAADIWEVYDDVDA